MESVSVDFDDAFYERIKTAASQCGETVEQFVKSAAEDKTSQWEIFEILKSRGNTSDNRAAFERVLAAVPDVDPIHPNDVIK